MNIILICNKLRISKLLSAVVISIPQKTNVKKKLDVNSINNINIECLYLTKIISSNSALY